MRTETEARYRVASAERLDQLALLDKIDRYTVSSGRTSHVQDTYLDTAGCDLAQQGWACRLRRDERGWTLTLKGPRTSDSEVITRAELETPLPGEISDPQGWPEGPWRDETLRLVGDQALTPWLIIAQERTRRLLSADDRVVAELSLDTVDLTSEGPRLYMLECELLPDGQPEDMQRIAAALAQVAGLTPEPRSKLELAVAADAERISAMAEKPAKAAKQAPPAPAEQPARAKVAPPRPEDSIWLGAAKVLERYRNDMLAHEAGTRLGEDPEELHDMRVATRRMRSAMRLVRPYLRSAHAGDAEDGLRELGAALGAVRDLDVALADLSAFRDQAGDKASGLQVLVDDWTAQREAARHEMLTYLSKKRYRRLLKDLRRLLDDLYAPREESGAHYVVSALVPRLVHVHWQSVEAHGQVAPDAPLEFLHQVRIECKRLRYALESYRNALPKRLTGAIPAVTALQDHLGELHDAAVAVERIDQTLAARGDLRGLEGVLAYRAACQARAVELERTFGEAWQRFQHEATRGRAALRRAVPSPAPTRRFWPPARWWRRAS